MGSIVRVVGLSGAFLLLVYGSNPTISLKKISQILHWAVAQVKTGWRRPRSEANVSYIEVDADSGRLIIYFITHVVGSG